jgi:hypothetical protein
MAERCVLLSWKNEIVALWAENALLQDGIRFFGWVAFTSHPAMRRSMESDTFHAMSHSIGTLRGNLKAAGRTVPKAMLLQF